MSLPSYSLKDAEEARPLRSAGSFDELAEADSVPVYPPTARAQGSGEPTERNVQYTFDPDYPCKIPKKHVLGRLGYTRAECVQIIKRGVPGLSEYPEHRIEFYLPIEGSSVEMCEVMEDVWGRFDASPPARIVVRVADGPGDADARYRYHWKIGIIIGTCVLSPFIVLAILGAMGKLDSGPK